MTGIANCERWPTGFESASLSQKGGGHVGRDKDLARGCHHTAEWSGFSLHDTLEAASTTARSLAIWVESVQYRSFTASDRAHEPFHPRLMAPGPPETRALNSVRNPLRHSLGRPARWPLTRDPSGKPRLSCSSAVVLVEAVHTGGKAQFLGPQALPPAARRRPQSR